MSLEKDKEIVKSHLREYPDFPSKGIIFQDIMPIFADPIAFRALINGLKAHIVKKKENPINYIVGLDARGFLFGPTLALELGIGFIPIRKNGKLPGEIYTASYEKEYGKDILNIQAKILKNNDNVIIIDDIIATGGSAKASGELVRKSGANILEYIFLMQIPGLNGKSLLDAPTYVFLDD